MTSCAIKVCRNYKGRLKTTKIVSYHRLPVDPILRHKWIDIIRKSRDEELWQPAKSSLVCSDHFHKKDIYFVDNQKRQRIKKGAVPCKALFISSLQSDGSSSDDDVDTNTDENTEEGSKNLMLPISVEPGPSNMIEVGQLQTCNLINTSDNAIILKHSEHEEDMLKKENEIEVAQDFSDDDSIVDTPREAKLRRDLRRKIRLQRKYILKIQALRRKNIRLTKKVATCKEIIRILKKRKDKDH